MNRRQRRAAGADIKRAVACPDCPADLQPVEVAPGRYAIEVRHHDSCPWFRQFQRDGGHGIRIITHPDERTKDR